MNGIDVKVILALLLMTGFGVIMLSPSLRPIEWPLWGASSSTSARTYRWQVMQSGFPILAEPRCALLPDEVVVLASRARLEHPLQRLTRETGRSWMRDVPCLNLSPVSWGRLIVTNKRLLFVGTDSCLSLALARGLTCVSFTRGLLVEVPVAGATHFFRFPYAQLFAEAIGLLQAFQWKRTLRQMLERVSERSQSPVQRSGAIGRVALQSVRGGPDRFVPGGFFSRPGRV